MKTFIERITLLARKPLFLLGVAALLGCGILFLWYAQASGLGISDLKTAFLWLIDRISGYPWLVFLAVVAVAGLPLPLSPVLIVAGVLFTNRYGLPMAVLICYLAMVLGMIWTYFVAAYPLRDVCERMLRLFSDRFPEVPEKHKFKVAAIIRITPGIPYFLQNYFLGFSRVPFGQYLFLSMAVQAFYTTAFVVGGGALFEGKAGLAISALAFMIVIGVVFQWLRSRKTQSGEALSV